MRFNSTGWLIGYFVVVAPFWYAMDWSLIHALIHCIFGVGIAVIMEAHR